MHASALFFFFSMFSSSLSQQQQQQQQDIDHGALPDISPRFPYMFFSRSVAGGVPGAGS